LLIGWGNEHVNRIPIHIPIVFSNEIPFSFIHIKGEGCSMKVDGVFSGGGIKAISFIGALQVAEEKGYEFVRLAGTSAGAIIASLIMAGYTSNEIEELINDIKLKDFLDPRKAVINFPALKWLRLYWKLGLYKGDALEEWLESVLAAKGIKTFGDIPADSLRVIASDITKGRIITFPDDLKNYGILPERFSVAKAVRMSASLPYFFEPGKIYTANGKKSLIVDGGVLSNFPIWVFQDEHAKPIRPILGFQLSSKVENHPPHKIKNAIGLFQALFETMKDAHDARYISEAHAADIIFIPVKQTSTTDFGLSPDKINVLIDYGRERAEKFLNKWRQAPIIF
jgi:NTE family protein